ncbi:paraquat-inducible protein B [mine drainage metagenome]|uniref:Paraquat-inducible protein B n=1 Tax=mine drainage metagenome TaxID=410659 RepID=A0A1J5QTG5_9ZZZZ
MESKVNFALVGAFVLILGTLLIGTVLWLSSDKSYRKSYDTYLVYMSESVSGLSLDAPVNYRGVQVGSVRRIELAPGNAEQVRLTLDIEHGTPVKQDTVAVLQVQGLTGIAHVELARGSRESPLLVAGPGEKYPVIRTGPSLMLRLDTEVSALLANLNRSSENVNALLDEENRITLRRTLVSLDRLTRALADHAGAIDAGLNHASRAMENTARLTDLASTELPQLLQRIERSADAFDRMASATARAGSSGADAIDSVRADTLPEARQAIIELRELTASLRRLSEEFQRNPAMMLQGRPAVPPGPGE